MTTPAPVDNTMRAAAERLAADRAGVIPRRHGGVRHAVAAWLGAAAEDAETVGADPHAVTTACAVLAELPGAGAEASGEGEAEEEPGCAEEPVTLPGPWAPGAERRWRRVLRYEFSVLPEDHPYHHVYALTVENCGVDGWAVCHRYAQQYLRADGTWAEVDSVLDSIGRWQKGCTFPLADALRLATQAAPRVTVDGMTPAHAAAVVAGES